MEKQKIARNTCHFFIFLIKMELWKIGRQVNGKNGANIYDFFHFSVFPIFGEKRKNRKMSQESDIISFFSFSNNSKKIKNSKISLLAVYSIFCIFEADFMINFPDHFLFSIFVCALKYVNMTRISNISFFRFCWENGKLDWPKCARTQCQNRSQSAS